MKAMHYVQPAAEKDDASDNGIVQLHHFSQSR